MKKYVFYFFLLFSIPVLLFSELPPDAYNRMVEASNEVLIIHVDEVQTDNATEDITGVSVFATVLFVYRSSSGLELGSTIRIQYQGRRVFPDHPGPARLGILEENSIRPAYLNKRWDHYVPSARGRSFSDWIWPRQYGDYEEYYQEAVEFLE